MKNLQPRSHTMSLFRYWGLRLLLSAIPAFLLWWMTLQTLWLPGLAKAESKAITELNHQVALIFIVQPDKGGRWTIENAVIKSPTRERQLVFGIKGWHFNVDNVYQFTLGLPVLWTLLLMVPRRRVLNLVMGTAVLSVLVVPVIAIKLWALVIRAVTSTAQTILLPGQRLPNYPAWLVNMAHALSDTMLYTSALILPIVLAYLLNRAFVLNELSAGKKG